MRFCSTDEDQKQRPANASGVARFAIALCCSVLACAFGGCERDRDQNADVVDVVPDTSTEPDSLDDADPDGDAQDGDVGETLPPDVAPGACASTDEPFIVHHPTVRSNAARGIGAVVLNPVPGHAAWIVETSTGSVRVARRCDFGSCNGAELLGDGLEAPIRLRESPSTGDRVMIDIGVVQTSTKSIGAIALVDAEGVQAPFATGLERPIDAVQLDDGRWAVAEFGALTGQVAIYDPSRETAPEVVHSGAGAVRLGLADFNGDGSKEIAVAIAQDGERVDVLTPGDGGQDWSSRTVFEAGEPWFGMSDMQVLDFDHDGDVDIVVAHGDLLDFDLPEDVSPDDYNGLHLLRNDGHGVFSAEVLLTRGATSLVDIAYPGEGLEPHIAVASNVTPELFQDFEYFSLGIYEHQGLSQGEPLFELTAPAFVSSVQWVDIDADGDLDVVATTFPSYLGTTNSRALVMLENCAAVD